jgi:hypothetical protein
LLFSGANHLATTASGYGEDEIEGMAVDDVASSSACRPDGRGEEEDDFLF